MTFFMAGGGTGGHVIPAIAVAHELQSRGHKPVFIGTRAGFEAKLVPDAGFPVEYIEIGGLMRVGLKQTIRTLSQLPAGFFRVLGLFKKYQPKAIFSMGGYVAGPVVLAALWRRLPVVIMEPNAMPGLTNRQMGRLVSRALLSFEESRRYFPEGRSEITGLPVRREFFDLAPKPRGDEVTILITGGSRGSRTLNESARQSWAYFKNGNVRLLHQTGADAYSGIRVEFAASGVKGKAMAFVTDMPAFFAQADLIVCRAGAGAVAELAAAGKPAILVPFPYASDDHQLRNAEALQRAGAATLVLDREMNGRRLYDEVMKLVSAPGQLEEMGQRARLFAHRDAAQRAADILVSLGGS